ncbi:hypothetical protein ODJ79_16040 [Actinoplanes sp. KI2]|uniref:hypothetical protein n=1 Tax=Actinoplanes sp. KI2 TaxID=2983315 RepID=UPI0021D5B0DC|nr:hypothetical protein [Actinoplanes sp. KI2]MCU7725240.1 hypothetical protein [Actinoplanes sp. KI2]
MLTTDILTAARAEALFASNLATGSAVRPAAATAAITNAIHRYGGSRGCAALVAEEFGDYPDTAAPRMQWARRVVAQSYRRGPISGDSPTPRTFIAPVRRSRIPLLVPANPLANRQLGACESGI